MHQRGFPTNQKSGRPHVTLSFTEAPLMRLSVGSLRQVVKRDLPIEFVPQQLTSYGGLELVLLSAARLAVPGLPLDADGTVVRTGAPVAWAFRGFNPHHRKDLSYYPLVAHVAQTGHILRLKNRPGNVHDSKQSAAFLRELIVAVRARLGRSLPLEFRMDAAFFQRDVLRLLAARRCAYAIKVGYWSWLPLKQLAAERRQWHALAPDVTGFEHQLVIPPWNLRLRVMIYRKHVQHESPKNFQLDLFTPDDGHFEYYAVATNMALSLPALYDFIGGRGA